MNGHTKGTKPYDRQDRERGHPEYGSRLFRGVHEFRVGNGGEELAMTPRRPHSSPKLRMLSPSVSAHRKVKVDRLVGYFPDGQSGQVKYNPVTEVAAIEIEPNAATNISEQAQDDPTTALQRARALIATSDHMVSETPFESGGADGSNSGARVDQRERLPQSIHKSRPVPLHLPPTLHKRDESHRGSPTLEYRTRPARPSSEGVKQSALHETSSRIHDRDRPLTVRDMEHFTKAIQRTIREMGSEFIEALGEMRRLEDIFEDDEDE